MQPSRRSSLFLLELMIAILLFILSAAICIQVFVKAHTIEVKSTNLNEAVLASESVAEIFRSDEDFEMLLSDTLQADKLADDRFQIYYDKNWEITSASDSAYVLEVTLSEETNFQIGNILVARNIKDESQSKSTPIYELTVKKYRNQGATVQ